MRAFATPELLSALGSLFYPATCVGCRENVERSEYLCLDCQRRAPRIVAPFCAKCSEPFSGAITQTFSCANCEHRKLHFDCAVAAYRSRGLVRKLVHDFKYGQQRHLRYPLASWLRETLDDSRLRDCHFDLIVPVPLHPARERERGFNQAALLAELLAASMKITTRPVLERTRYTTTQTAYDRAERMENLAGAFRLRKNRDVRDLRVLLIDDVLTTGSTLSECARVLRRAGAVSVHAATAARA
jgi:competence protein ComFC